MRVAAAGTAGLSFDTLSMLVLAVVLVLVAATFQHYGISWDEEIQNTYGKKILSFYLSGFEDQSVFKHFNLYLYGGSFDLVAAIVNTVSPFGEYETRHLLGGLVGTLGLAGIWRLGRLFGGPRVGFLALLADGRDAGLLRPYVHQSQGHTVRLRHGLVALPDVPRDGDAAAGAAQNPC